MQTDQHSFHRFKIGRIQYCTGHSHRVETVARRERIEEILQGIPLIIILDGITKIECISSIGFQCILQSDDHLLPIRLNFGLLHLRRGYYNLLIRLVKLDKFIELNGKFIFIVMECAGRGSTGNKTRRSLIIRSSFNTAHTGTRIQCGSYGNTPNNLRKSGFILVWRLRSNMLQK